MFTLSKTVGLAAIISLGLAISGCGNKPEDTKPAANEKEHTPSWLFVVHDSKKSDGTTTTFTFHSAKHNPTDDVLSELMTKKQLNNVVLPISNKKGWLGCTCKKDYLTKTGYIRCYPRHGKCFSHIANNKNFFKSCDSMDCPTNFCVGACKR